MKFINSLYFVGVSACTLVGCIVEPPSWVSESVREDWMEIRQLQATYPHQLESRIQESSIDVFSSFFEHSPPIIARFEGVTYREEEGGELAMAFAAFANRHPALTGCADLVGRFWIYRPSWYFPTRSEVITVQQCVFDGLNIIGAEERGNVVSELAARTLASIGSAVFSPRTCLVLARPETPIVASVHGLEQGLVEWLLNPTLRRLVDTAVAGSASVQAEWLLSELEAGIPSDSALIHASDYLDHLGHEEASLEVWRRLFIRSPTTTRTRVERLVFLISVKPDVVSSARSAQRRRLTNYQRGMGRAWSSWRTNTGSLIWRVWSNATHSGRDLMERCMNSPISLESLRDVFTHFESNERMMYTFYNCFINHVLDGNLVIPSGARFSTDVANLLYMMKISSDPLYLVDFFTTNH